MPPVINSEHLATILKETTGLTEGMERFVTECLANGAQQQAEKILRKYTKKNPTCVAGHYAQALLQHRLGDTEQLRTAARLALSCDPNHPPTRALLPADQIEGLLSEGRNLTHLEDTFRPLAGLPTEQLMPRLPELVQLVKENSWYPPGIQICFKCFQEQQLLEEARSLVTFLDWAPTAWRGRHLAFARVLIACRQQEEAIERCLTLLGTGPVLGDAVELVRQHTTDPATRALLQARVKAAQAIADTEGLKALAAALASQNSEKKGSTELPNTPAQARQLEESGDPAGAIRAYERWAVANPTAENYLLAAEAAERLGDFGIAENLYCQSRKLNRTDPRARAGIDRIRQRGKTETATPPPTEPETAPSLDDAIRRIIENTPAPREFWKLEASGLRPRSQALVRRARECWERGDGPAAISLLSQLALLGGEVAQQARFNVALLHVRNGDFEIAEEVLFRLEGELPDSTEIRWLLIACSLAQQNFGDALEHLDRWLKQQPAATEARILALALAARQKDYRRARQLLAKLPTMEDANLRVIVNHCKAAGAQLPPQSAGPEAAVPPPAAVRNEALPLSEIREALLQNAPNIHTPAAEYLLKHSTPEQVRDLFVALRQAGDPLDNLDWVPAGEGGSLFRVGLGWESVATGTPEQRRTRALFAFAERRWADAAEWLSPGFEAVLCALHRGELSQVREWLMPPEAVLLDNPPNNLRELKKSAQFTPDEQQRYNRAQTYFEAGNFAEAAKQFRNAGSKDVPLQFLLNEAICRLKLGQEEEALQLLKKFRDLHPSDQGGLTLLGWTYLRLRRFSEASRVHEDMLRRQENGRAKFILAVLALRNRETRPAEEILNNPKLQAWTVPLLRAHLSVLLQEDTDAARSAAIDLLERRFTFVPPRPSQQPEPAPQGWASAVKVVASPGGGKTRLSCHDFFLGRTSPPLFLLLGGSTQRNQSPDPDARRGLFTVLSGTWQQSEGISPENLLHRLHQKLQEHNTRRRPGGRFGGGQGSSHLLGSAVAVAPQGNGLWQIAEAGTTRAFVAAGRNQPARPVTEEGLPTADSANPAALGGTSPALRVREQVEIPPEGRLYLLSDGAYRLLQQNNLVSAEGEIAGSAVTRFPELLKASFPAEDATFVCLTPRDFPELTTTETP